MAKGKKWKYKHLTEEKFAEYQGLEEEELVKTLKAQAEYQEQCKSAKNNDYLKDLKKDIADFRRDWNKDHASELEEAKAAMDALKEARDEGIQDALDEKKDLEGGLNDALVGANEHIEALLFCLRFHK